MAPKDFIVAIELGSSKMTGIAGKKNLDGSISVLAVVSEDSSTFIRKGVIYNIDKTAQCISSIVKRLTAILKTSISQVYVGVGGQSIRSLKNVIVKNLAADTIVTQEMVNELMDANRNMSYQDQEILDAATQEYKVDNQYQMDPVGIQCTRLEGNFLNILWRKMFYRNLNTHQGHPLLNLALGSQQVMILCAVLVGREGGRDLGLQYLVDGDSHLRVVRDSVAVMRLHAVLSQSVDDGLGVADGP